MSVPYRADVQTVGASPRRNTTSVPIAERICEGEKMSVLIKGMEMPKNCDVCPLIAEADDYHVCYINEQFIPWEWVDEHSAEQRHPKPSWCPLVEIPPHGRLIIDEKGEVIVEQES